MICDLMDDMTYQNYEEYDHKITKNTIIKFSVRNYYWRFNETFCFPIEMILILD